ncbi:MAG: glycosyltransferase family 2 protein [Candidatus Verstraetearchaeota archaeon]|nr:glycosyltransferase family 2 protein [Candidatus Verstraetearchaeota archaeon]
MVDKHSTGGKFLVAGIPAHNEEKTIASVILKVKPFVDAIFVCDDGSTDMTAEIAEALGAVVISNPTNMGYGAAISSLFRVAVEIGADVLVTLDADAQHEPRYIPDLVSPIIKNEADLVIGSRFLGNGHVPYPKKYGIKLINAVVNISSDKKITDTQSGFRAYGRKALDCIMVSEHGMSASTEILLDSSRKGLRISEVPVRITYPEKQSNIRSLTQGMSVVLNTLKLLSIRHPTKIYGIPAAIFMLIGFTFGIWCVQSYSQNGYVPINLALIAVGSTLLAFLFFSLMMILWVTLTVTSQDRR